MDQLGEKDTNEGLLISTVTDSKKHNYHALLTPLQTLCKFSADCAPHLRQAGLFPIASDSQITDSISIVQFREEYPHIVPDFLYLIIAEVVKFIKKLIQLAFLARLIEDPAHCIDSDKVDDSARDE